MSKKFKILSLSALLAASSFVKVNASDHADSSVTNYQSNVQQHSLKMNQDSDGASDFKQSLHIFNIPEIPNVLSKEDLVNFHIEALSQIVNFYLTGKEPESWQFTKLYCYTLPESELYFSHYFKEKLGEKKFNEIKGALFSDKWFGHSVNDVINSSAEIAKNDPYLFTVFFNYFSKVEYHADKDRLFEYVMKESKRFTLKTRFLEPEEVARAYKERGVDWWAKKHSVEHMLSFKEIFNNHFFGFPNDPTLRKKFFLSNKIGFLDQEMMKKILNTATRIMGHSKPGSRFVIFGNTPYFVGRALTHLISSTPTDPNHRIIIDFPFSGSPNIERSGSSFNDSNIVTMERLQHLKNRLHRQGLSHANDDLLKTTTYFIDAIGSGAGPAYVIEEILRDFITNGFKQLPDLQVITINQIDVNNLQDTRNRAIADKSANDGEELKLFFPNKTKPRFSVQAKVIYLPGHSSLDMLPNEDWRIFPEYNAAFWNKDYDYLLTKEPENHTKGLLEFFDTNITHFLGK